MATNRSGHRPGGGIASRVNVQPKVRTGTGSRGTRPAGVAMLGSMQGSHVTRGEDSNYRGEPLHNDRSFQPVKFGNEVALNVGKGGCGTGRTNYGHNAAPGNAPAKNKDILSDYGPDYRRPSNPGRSDTDADF